MHVDGFRFDLAPVLGRGDARLRPRRRPSSRRVRAGPGAVAREADRRALGPRPRRLPGRAAFRAAGSSGTTASATPCAPSGCGGDSTRGDFALRLCGSSDLFQPRRRAPAESVNYVVSHDGFTLPTWSATTRATTRPTARTTATATATTSAGTAASKARPTTPRSTPCAPACSARCWPRCCCRRARRCWPPATSSATARAATTTPTARTTRSPGSTGRAPTSRLIDFTAHVLRAAPPHAAAGPALVHRAARPPRPGRPGLAAPRRRGDDAGALAQPHVARAWAPASAQPGRGGAPLLLLVNASDEDARFELPPGDWVAAGHHAAPTAAAPGAVRTTRRTTRYELRARSLVLLRDAGGATELPGGTAP